MIYVFVIGLLNGKYNYIVISPSGSLSKNIGG